VADFAAAIKLNPITRGKAITNRCAGLSVSVGALNGCPTQAELQCATPDARSKGDLRHHELANLAARSTRVQHAMLWS